jgi:phospholipid/cholesterol/gamma-HCH transport system substrate-binding protein
MTRLWRTARDEHSQNRSQLLLGVVGVFTCVVCLVAAAALFVFPLGQHTYTAELRSSGGARAGDEVRVAGIKVGKVTSVTLHGNRVYLDFAVDDDVHVGDDASVAIKLLTPIGGRYVALTTAGDEALGEQHIPAERTSLPFEIGDVLEKGTPVLQQVDATTLRATVEEVNRAISGQPDAIRELLDNATSLTAVVAKRSDQLEKGLDISDEYLAAVDNDKAQLAQLFRELGVVTVELGQRRVEVVQVFNLLRRLFALIHRPVLAYAEGIEPSVDAVEQLFNKLVADQSGIDSVITQLQGFIHKLSEAIGLGNGVTIDQSHADVGAPTLCIPTPGKEC